MLTRDDHYWNNLKAYEKYRDDPHSLKVWAQAQGYPDEDTIAEDSLILVAIRDNNVRAVRMLLDMGYSPNIAFKERESSLLHDAIDDQASPANQQVISLLIERGANLSYRLDSNLTPNEYAQLKGRSDVLALLKRAAGGPP